jgi:hypothetical protein
VRLLGVLVSALAALALGCAEGDAATSSTSLTITVWPEGKGEGTTKRTWTLRCAPAGGTLPRPGIACQRLFANLSALKPVPSDRACILLYGGPQVAEIRGTVRGKRVRATLTRTDGCEIARWDALKALLPVRV